MVFQTYPPGPRYVYTNMKHFNREKDKAIYEIGENIKEIQWAIIYRQHLLLTVPEEAEDCPSTFTKVQELKFQLLLEKDKLVQWENQVRQFEEEPIGMQVTEKAWLLGLRFEELRRQLDDAKIVLAQAEKEHVQMKQKQDYATEISGLELLTLRQIVEGLEDKFVAVELALELWWKADSVQLVESMDMAEQI